MWSWGLFVTVDGNLEIPIMGVLIDYATDSSIIDTKIELF